MDKAQKRIFYVMGLWLSLIFVTSSFVIPFGTFVHFIQSLSANSAFKQWFAQFWLVSWFVIVKGWHATEYAVLACISTGVLQTLTKWHHRKCLTAAFAFAVLFAASDEWHQTFVPGRDGCIRDVLIDSAGALTAVILLSLLQSRRAEILSSHGKMKWKE